jgi:hypothetical protein
VPEISRFFGIVIGMFYNEHGPPHFHAVHGDCEATVEIESARVGGYLPPRALGLVREWAQLHQAELRENWRLAQSRERLQRIAPLE